MFRMKWSTQLGCARLEASIPVCPSPRGTEPRDSIKILVIHCRTMRMVGCLISGVVFPKAVAIGMFYWYNRKDPPVQRPSASSPQISGKKKRGQPKGHDGFTQLDSGDMVPWLALWNALRKQLQCVATCIGAAKSVSLPKDRMGAVQKLTK